MCKYSVLLCECLVNGAHRYKIKVIFYNCLRLAMPYIQSNHICVIYVNLVNSGERSGSMLDSRPRGRASILTGVTVL